MLSHRESRGTRTNATYRSRRPPSRQATVDHAPSMPLSGEPEHPQARSLADWTALELAHIAIRRRNAGKSPEESVSSLVGLAISGGGIRSATFALGFVQQLSRSGAFRHFDYLSTVSGGGYLGSCLTNLLSRSDPAKAAMGRFPFSAGHDSGEGSVVRHLRANSSHLTGSGLLGYFRIAAVLLRGIALNLLLVAPALLGAMALTLALYGPELKKAAELDQWEENIHGAVGTEPFLRRIKEEVCTGREDALCAEGSPLPFLKPLRKADLVQQLRGATEFEKTRALIDKIGDDKGIYYQLRPSVTVREALLALYPDRRVALELPLTSVLLGFAFLSLGIAPLTALFGWLRGRTTFRSSRSAPGRWRRLYDKTFPLLLVALLLSAVVESQPWLVQQFHYFRHGYRADWASILTVLAGVSTLAAGPLLQVLRRFGPRLAVAFVGGLGALLPLLAYLLLLDWSFYGQLEDTTGRWTPAGVAFLGMVATYVVGLLIDVNSTSMLYFYRDRLVSAFQLRWRGSDVAEATRAEETLPLSLMSPAESGAPYHLINTALNLPGSRDLDIHGRKCENLILSRIRIGNDRLGYCHTAAMEDYFPDLDLASAMAVSGAAVAPNMGTYTSRASAILMTLLNFRLGFWIPNPRRIARWSAAGARPSLLRRLRAFPVGQLLLREALGRIHDRGASVNLSDGGHFENTGAYELLRRRCRFIVVSDAERDPARRFGGLAKLMRYARIDMNIEIDIDIGCLRADSGGFSERHWAAGPIRYPDTAEDGVLLYLKPALTGDEDTILMEYAASNPDFPHESTTDQSFDEAQFEAYRSLGFHAVETLLHDTSFKEPDALARLEVFTEWFSSLPRYSESKLSPEVTR